MKERRELISLGAEGQEGRLRLGVPGAQYPGDVIGQLATAVGGGRQVPGRLDQEVE